MFGVPKVIYPKDDYRLMVREVLYVDDDLDKHFRQQALLYGRIAHFGAQAKYKVRNIKSELDVLSAKLRKIIARRGKHTKDEMQAALIRKKVYRLKLKELNDAIYTEDLMAGLLRALEHKRDALVGLGANYRHDNGELRMLKKEMRSRIKKRSEYD